MNFVCYISDLKCNIKMRTVLLLIALFCAIQNSVAEETRLLDLDPPEAHQVIEKQDQSLHYAPKVDSNVPAVRYLGNEPHDVQEDIYLARQYHGQDGVGGYLYGYNIPDIAKTEKKIAGGDLRGAYNYINNDGQEIKVQYWDDGTGFHQIDNVPKILPKQIDDLPEVKAEKDKFLARWHEEAERNSHPVTEPYDSNGNYASGPLSLQGQLEAKQKLANQYPQGSNQQYQPSGQYNQQSAYQPSLSNQQPGQYSQQSSSTHQQSGSYQQPGQQSGSYQQSGQQSVSYPQTGQQSGSYPQTGQQSGSYPQTGQQSGSYPQSGQQSGSYPQSGQQSGSYQQTSQQSGSYQQPGQQSGSYQQPGQQSGSYQQPGQHSESYQQPGQQSGSYQQPGQQSGSYQQPGQHSGSYPQSGQQSGSYQQPGGSYQQPNQYQQNGQSHQSQPGQYQQSSQHQQPGQYQQSGQQSGVQPNEIDYSGQFSENKNVYSQSGNSQYAKPGQSDSTGSASQYGQSKQYQQDGSYQQGSYSDSNQVDNSGQYNKKSEEENGPPKGFFYSYDYPVGKIVSVGGISRTAELKNTYTENKSKYESQLNSGRSNTGGSQSSYLHS